MTDETQDAVAQHGKLLGGFRQCFGTDDPKIILREWPQDIFPTPPFRALAFVLNSTRLDVVIKEGGHTDLLNAFPHVLNKRGSALSREDLYGALTPLLGPDTYVQPEPANDPAQKPVGQKSIIFYPAAHRAPAQRRKEPETVIEAMVGDVVYKLGEWLDARKEIAAHPRLKSVLQNMFEECVRDGMPAAPLPPAATPFDCYDDKFPHLIKDLSEIFPAVGKQLKRRKITRNGQLLQAIPKRFRADPAALLLKINKMCIRQSMLDAGGKPWFAAEALAASFGRKILPTSVRKMIYLELPYCIPSVPQTIAPPQIHHAPASTRPAKAQPRAEPASKRLHPYV